MKNYTVNRGLWNYVKMIFFHTTQIISIAGRLFYQYHKKLIQNAFTDVYYNPNSVVHLSGDEIHFIIFYFNWGYIEEHMKVLEHTAFTMRV